jgi:hypothetical protein
MGNGNQRPWWAKNEATAAPPAPRFRGVAYVPTFVLEFLTVTPGYHVGSCLTNTPWGAQCQKCQKPIMATGELAF